MDTDSPHRTPTAEALKEKQSRQVVAPFSKRFSGWQLKLAHLRGIRRSSRTTDEAYFRASSDLGVLLEDVKLAESDFNKAAIGFEHTTRVRDGFAAFARLTEQVVIELAEVRPGVEDLLIIPPPQSAALLTPQRNSRA